MKFLKLLCPSLARAKNTYTFEAAASHSTFEMLQN